MHNCCRSNLLTLGGNFSLDISFLVVLCFLSQFDCAGVISLPEKNFKTLEVNKHETFTHVIIVSGQSSVVVISSKASQ